MTYQVRVDAAIVGVYLTLFQLFVKHALFGSRVGVVATVSVVGREYMLTVQGIDAPTKCSQPHHARLLAIRNTSQ